MERDEGGLYDGWAHRLDQIFCACPSGQIGRVLADIDHRRAWNQPGEHRRRPGRKGRIYDIQRLLRQFKPPAASARVTAFFPGARLSIPTPEDGQTGRHVPQRSQPLTIFAACRSRSGSA